jgi:hypothetical protein
LSGTLVAKTHTENAGYTKKSKRPLKGGSMKSIGCSASLTFILAGLIFMSPMASLAADYLPAATHPLAALPGQAVKSCSMGRPATPGECQSSPRGQAGNRTIAALALAQDYSPSLESSESSELLEDLIKRDPNP